MPEVESSSPTMTALRSAVGGHLGRGLRVLKEPVFRRYWKGQAVSLCGSWMQLTAQGWLVYELTHSAKALGLLALLQFLPVTLLCLLGGVVADRLPKRKVLLVLNALGLVQAGVFAVLVLSGAIAYWHICVLVAIGGVLSALDMPVRQAFTSELTEKEHLANAISVNALSFNLARIVGPALAGLLMDSVGVGVVFVLNALSYGYSVWTLAGLGEVDVRTPPKRTKVSLREHFRECFVFLKRTPLPFGVLISMAGVGIFGFNFNVLFPILAGSVLGLDAKGLGLLTASFGVGALFGALSTAMTQGVTLQRATAFTVAFGVLLMGVGFVHAPWSAATVLVLAGFAGIAMATSYNTLLQLSTPAPLRGRIMSLWVLVFLGSSPLGGTITGHVIDHLGVRMAVVLNGTLMLVFLAVGVWVAKKKPQGV